MDRQVSEKYLQPVLCGLLLLAAKGRVPVYVPTSKLGVTTANFFLLFIFHDKTHPSGQTGHGEIPSGSIVISKN